MLIDTLKHKTVLTKEGTKAVGNLLKKGQGYEQLFKEQTVLVDSLKAEISKRKVQDIRYRDTIVPILNRLNKEQGFEITLLKERNALQQESYEAQLKNQRAKKWTWAGGGALIGVLLMLFFGG